MSFGQNVAATKIELLKYKKSTQVAVMVQKILDDKRKVLLKNIEEMINEASKARGEFGIHCKISTKQSMRHTWPLAPTRLTLLQNQLRL